MPVAGVPLLNRPQRVPSSNPRVRPETQYRDQHVIRLLACTAASLCIAIGAVKLWPVVRDHAPREPIYSTSGPEIIAIDDILPTTQPVQPPPPPAPLPPIVVPDDTILEEDLTFDEDFLRTDEIGLAHEVTPGDAAETEGASVRAESDPKPIRIAAPEYTRAAKRKNIRAEIVVAVVIDRHGRVEQSTIVDRFLLSEDDGLRQRVEELGYGLEESAVTAAERCLFRPARVNGLPVRSQHELSFKFGV